MTDIWRMPVCKICLKDTGGGAGYHPRCLRNLFETSVPPKLDLDLGGINDLARGMVGRMSISGVQQKLLVSLTADRTGLEVTPRGGRYILKPPVATFAEIPANEHVTMRMARLVGIEAPACALLELNDGSLAYIIRRFDRQEDGTKLQQEDFCQLAQLSPSRKYDGSAELCVRLLRQFATEPLVSILSLYRLLVFAWCTGNGDLHLKNLSLLTGTDGIRRLAPAYDLVNTRLVIPDDPLALPIGGKKSHLRRGSWMDFADYCQIPRRAAERVLLRQISAVGEMNWSIERSFLSAELKAQYKAIVGEHVSALAV